MMNDPMDIFDEMDEMFARLFSGTGQRMNDDPFFHEGRRIAIRGSDEDAEPDSAGEAGQAAFKPSADVQQIGDEVKVVADLPGITGDSLRLGVRNGKLIIDAGDADYHYHTTAILPPVDVASMKYTLKNGVLDVTFTGTHGQKKQD